MDLSLALVVHAAAFNDPPGDRRWDVACISQKNFVPSQR